MKGLSLRTAITLLLGAFVVFGWSLSGVQTNDMTVKMVLSGDVDGKAPTSCDSPGDGNDCAGAGCTSMCISNTAAVLQTISSLKIAYAPDKHFRVLLILQEIASAPDPYPPKT